MASSEKLFPTDVRGEVGTESAVQTIPRRSITAIGIYLIVSFLAQISLLIEFWPKTSTPAAPNSTFSIWFLNISDQVISIDGRIMVVVLLSGGVGAMVHTIRSFTAHLGVHGIRRGWGWWYFMRPLEGAVMALAFYFVLRGGLVSSSASESASISIYGVAAIAVLVGMFSQQAVTKLKDLAETLFTKSSQVVDSRTGETANPCPTLTALLPPSVRLDMAEAPIAVIGTNFLRSSQIRIDETSRSPTFISGTELALALMPEDLVEPGTRKIFVVNPLPGGGGSNVLELIVEAN